MENFEYASRKKLRFESGQGALSVEELWDLNLNALDTIAKKVSKLIQAEGEESFIPTKNTVKTDNSLKLDILKHIIVTKVEENDVRKARVQQQEHLARLKALAANKQDEAFGAQSLEEINKQIAEMEAKVLAGV